MQRPVRHPLAQHVDHAAFADLAGEAGQELEAIDVPGVVRVGHPQPLERLGLRGAQEGEELRHVEGVGAVVVPRAAGGVAAAAVGRGRFGGRVRRDGQAIHAGHVSHDQGFEAFFTGVGGAHISAPHARPGFVWAFVKLLLPARIKQRESPIKSIYCTRRSLVCVGSNMALLC